MRVKHSELPESIIVLLRPLRLVSCAWEQVLMQHDQYHAWHNWSWMKGSSAIYSKNRGI